MKLAFLSITTASITLQCMAQPVLTHNSMQLPVGETYQRASFDYVEPGNGGANQIWDFTSESISVLEPVQIANAQDYPWAETHVPEASHALSMDVEGFETVNFMSLTSSGIYLQGMLQPDVIEFPYSNSRLELALPFSYTNTFQDEYAYSTEIEEDIVLSANGTIEGVSDGYGTIILPNGEQINNVLRINISTTEFDTVYFDGFPIIVSEITEQSTLFYTPSLAMPVLRLTMFTIDGETTTSAEFLSGEVASTTDIGPLSDLNLFPNPAQDRVSIRAKMKIQGSVMLAIHDLTGRLVYRTNALVAAGELSMPDLSLQTFNKGVYFVTVSSGSHQITEKLVVR